MAQAMGGFGTRTALQRQLAIEWTFAEQVVLGRIDLGLALWEPTPGRTYTVHDSHGVWMADWPDEANDPPRTPTIGWILWHIEWWWTDTLALVHDQTRITPQQHAWSGGTERIRRLKERWGHVLDAEDLDRRIQWVMPELQPLGMIAAWVNFELAKNLSEISQLSRLHDASG